MIRQGIQLETRHAPARRRAPATRIVLVVASLLAAPLAFLSPVAHASPGAVEAVLDFSSPCSSGTGIGMAFDGENLWYSCYASTPDLFRADPSTGTVTASYAVKGGLGGLSYDPITPGIWAG